MKLALRRCALAASLLLACDGDDKASKGTADAKGDAKDKKKAEKKADDKSGDAAAKTPADADAAALDVSHDKSGILARSAAALEGVDTIDNEDLNGLAHDVDEHPSFNEVCAHIASVRGKEFDTDKCVKDYEHRVVRIGPELYGEVAACELAAKTVADLDACDKAEEDAEKALHEKPHGDGLDAETCGEFFVTFEKLAMADAGKDAELVKEVLEEVKDDLLDACKDQGTKAEIECSKKAKTLGDLRECSPGLL